MKAVFPPDEVGRQDEQADDRREPRGECRPENPHAAGKEEEVIQHHIGQAAPQHRRHGKLRRAVVSHEAQAEVVQQEGGRKEQDDLQIGAAHSEDGFVGPQEPGQFLRTEQPQQNEPRRQPQGKPQRMGKNAVGLPLFSLVLRNGIARAASHADQQAAPVDKAVDRNGQIQRG